MPATGVRRAAFDTHALVEVPRVAARHALGAVPAAVVRDGVRVVGAAAALVGLHGCPRRVVAIAAEAVIARGKAIRGGQLEDAHTVVLRPRVDARLGHVAGGAGVMTGPAVEVRAALALGAVCPERIASRAAGARVAAVYVATAICFFPGTACGIDRARRPRSQPGTWRGTLSRGGRSCCGTRRTCRG